MSNLLEPLQAESWPVDGLETLGYCPVCGGTRRKLLYNELTDRLFGAPGQWTMYQCLDCKSGYLDPRPTEDTIGLAYTNYATHLPEPERSTNLSFLKKIRVAMRNGYLNRKYNYTLTPAVAWGFYAMYLLPPPLRQEWDHYARHLPQPKPGRDKLLDVGCGNGAFLIRARAAGWKVFGIDFDPQAAALAQEQGIDVWVGNYRDAPFEAESFDIITAEQVIEHVHQPTAFVSCLYQWLKPSGQLWLGTPNLESRLHRIFKCNCMTLHPPQHLILFTWKSLEHLLIDKDFISAKLLPRGFHEYYVLVESFAMSEGRQGWQQIMTMKYLSLHMKILAWYLESSTYFNPKRGSDLVVTAKKSKLLSD